jgi:hypothetical protein
MNRPITFRTQFLMNSITLALVAVLLLASNTFANPGTASTTASTQTTTISYQGHLTDNAGEPVNGDLPMTFALYDAPTGGTAVWTEERSGSNTVPVSEGLFNVLLGSVTPIDVNLFQQQGLWLGISVNGDAEMTPREPLSDVAYAAVAGTVVEGGISQAQAPGLVAGPEDDVKVAYGSTTVSQDRPGKGFTRINIEEYGFTEPPTALCSMAGSSGFFHQCHVEYETNEDFGIWVRATDGANGWTKEVRWIAIGR